MSRSTMLGCAVLLLFTVGCSQSDRSNQESSAETTESASHAGPPSVTLKPPPLPEKPPDMGKHSSSAIPSERQEGRVVGLYMDGLILPIAKLDGDTFYSASAWRAELLLNHPRYVHLNEPPGIFTVDSLGWRTFSNHGAAYRRSRGAPPAEVVGSGRVTDPIPDVPPSLRLDAVNRGPLAVSVSSNSPVDLRSLVPKEDTTLTASQRTIIAEQVARRLVDNEKKAWKEVRPDTTLTVVPRETLARRLSVSLSPSPGRSEAGSPLAVDVVSKNVRTDGTTEHLVAVERRADLVMAKKMKGEEDRRLNGFMADAEGRFQIVSGDSALASRGVEDDSVEKAVFADVEQAAAFVGRISGGRWQEVASTVRGGQKERSLQVLNTDGIGMPEILFLEMTASTYNRYWSRVFVRYDEGQFNTVARFDGESLSD